MNRRRQRQGLREIIGGTILFLGGTATALYGLYDLSKSDLSKQASYSSKESLSVEERDRQSQLGTINDFGLMLIGSTAIIGGSALIDLGRRNRRPYLYSTIN